MQFKIYFNPSAYTEYPFEVHEVEFGQVEEKVVLNEIYSYTDTKQIMRNRMYASSKTLEEAIIVIKKLKQDFSDDTIIDLFPNVIF